MGLRRPTIFIYGFSDLTDLRILTTGFYHKYQPNRLVIASAAKQSAKVFARFKLGFCSLNNSILNLINPLLKLGQIASLRSQ
jgi:hypothetical protein